jgi:hypothetical protein
MTIRQQFQMRKSAYKHSLLGLDIQSFAFLMLCLVSVDCHIINVMLSVAISNVMLSVKFFTVMNVMLSVTF